MDKLREFQIARELGIPSSNRNKPYTLGEVLPIGKHGIDVLVLAFVMQEFGIYLPDRRQMTPNQAWDTILHKIGFNYKGRMGENVEKLISHLCGMYGTRWLTHPVVPDYAVMAWERRY